MWQFIINFAWKHESWDSHETTDSQFVSWLLVQCFHYNQYVCFCLQARPFSPPVSGSPPPFAPLARAESSSSISSITSQSAASTPTLGRDLNLANTGTLRARLVSYLSLCPCLSPGSSLCAHLTVLSLSMILSSSCLCSLRGLTASGMVWPRQVLFSFWRWVEPEHLCSAHQCMD